MNPAHARARTKITVQSSEAKPYETTSPTLVEIHISEKFLGDIDGESSVRALQVQRDDKFATHGQHATVHRKTERTPRHIRASR